MLFSIEVNNNIITAQRGETILECLNRNGIFVPTLCHIEGYSPTGACRICVVEVEGRPDLIPSCSHPVEEWMHIKTHSPRVIRARKAIAEMLLSNHPDDCLFCERNGNCELQKLSIDLNLREKRFTGKKISLKNDYASASIMREPSKCILCGRCIRLCETEQEVAAVDFIGRGNQMTIGTSYNHGLSLKNCHQCGQCILICPTGALSEQQHISKVQDVLHKPNQHLVAQFSPALSASLGENFGLKPGKVADNLIVAALSKIGFSKIFDNGVGCDLNIIENAALLANRIREGETMPLFTSCCPSWVHYAETFHPEILPHLSSVLSPQQIMSVLIKWIYAKEEGWEVEDVYTVGLMPCTAKKYEIIRQEMLMNDLYITDAVLTTRELAKFIRLYGIDINNIEPLLPHQPFHIRSTAAKLFGVSGGVTEAILRTVYYMLTGNECSPLTISELRTSNLSKFYTIQAGEYSVRAAVVSSMHQAEKLLQEIEAGKINLDFVEVMACPGGCINGGGQKIGTSQKELKMRSKSIYDIDERENIRVAHKNPIVTELYQKYFGAPLSQKAIEFLHKRKLEKKLEGNEQIL